MHILIVDDERPSRAELHFILSELVATAVYHEARNGQEALDIIAREQIDVLFLDINMPGMSGLTVAATIMDRPTTDDHPHPLIIFATAYDAHAVRAFELAALDYIVKPFSEARIAQTMIRVRKALAEREQRAVKQAALQGYLREQQLPLRLTKLWGDRGNERSVLVDYSDVLWVEALTKRVFINTKNGENLRIRYTIKELETRLADHDFVRIHKSYLVNLNHVAEVAKGFSGTYTVIMDDPSGTRLPMSRQYGKRLRDILRGSKL